MRSPKPEALLLQWRAADVDIRQSICATRSISARRARAHSAEGGPAALAAAAELNSPTADSTRTSTRRPPRIFVDGLACNSCPAAALRFDLDPGPAPRKSERAVDSAQRKRAAVESTAALILPSGGENQGLTVSSSSTAARMPRMTAAAARMAIMTAVPPMFSSL